MRRAGDGKREREREQFNNSRETQRPSNKNDRAFSKILLYAQRQRSKDGIRNIDREWRRKVASEVERHSASMEEWSSELREKMLHASQSSVKLCHALHLLLHSKKLWEQRAQRRALKRLKGAGLEVRSRRSRDSAHRSLVRYARSKSVRILKRDALLEWAGVVSRVELNPAASREDESQPLLSNQTSILKTRTTISQTSARRSQRRVIRKLLRRRMKTNLGAAWTEWKESLDDLKRQDRASRFCIMQLRSKAFTMWGQYAIMKQQRRGLLHTLVARRGRLLLLYGFLQLKSVCRTAGTTARLAALIASQSVVKEVALARHLKRQDVLQARRAMEAWQALVTKARGDKLKVRRALIFVSVSGHL